MNIDIIEAYNRLDDIRELFSEYTAWIGRALDFQNFDQEFASLPGYYAKPDGGLYLLLADGEAAGCVALRYFNTEKNGRQRGEIKRLYIRDKFKAKGLGKMLANRVINDARDIGYTDILLDSFTFMESAIAMYKKLGFEEIEPYRYNPYDDVKYLRLRLR